MEKLNLGEELSFADLANAINKIMDKIRYLENLEFHNNLESHFANDPEPDNEQQDWQPSEIANGFVDDKLYYQKKHKQDERFEAILQQKLKEKDIEIEKLMNQVNDEANEVYKIKQGKIKVSKELIRWLKGLSFFDYESIENKNELLNILEESNE